MCFHNSLSKSYVEIAERYGVTIDVSEITTEKKYHIGAFTNPFHPVITADGKLSNMQWGLIPYWVKDRETAGQIRKKTINARAETLFEKPSFKTPIMRTRCIVPSTGYYEWHHEGTRKIPYFIHVKDQEIFSIGGIYDNWLDRKTGEIISTFSMITTEANELTGFIHNGGVNPNRMPLIIMKEDEKKWLDPHLDMDSIKELLKPFPADLMNAYIIKNDFLKKDDNDPTIILAAKFKNDDPKLF